MNTSLVAYDDSDSEAETGKSEDATSSKVNLANSATSAVQSCGGLHIISESKIQPVHCMGSSRKDIFHQDGFLQHLQADKNILATEHLKKIHPTMWKMGSSNRNQSVSSLLKPKILSGNESFSQKRACEDSDSTIPGLRPYIPKRLRQEKDPVLHETKDCGGNTRCATQLSVGGDRMCIETSEYIMPYIGSKYGVTEIPKNLVFQMSEHSGPVNAVWWSPVQKWSHMLLSASMDKTVKVAMTSEMDSLGLGDPPGQEKVQRGVCVKIPQTPYEWRQLLFSQEHLEIQAYIYFLVWDAVDRGCCLKTYSCHTCAVRAAQWSPCGRQALSGGFDSMLHLTDIETGTQIFSGSSNFRISTLKFHPLDPNVFICGGFSPEVKAWDIRTSKVIKVYKAAVQQTLDIMFLPEGKEFLTSTDAVSQDSADRTIIAWDFHTAAKISNQIFHERYTCPTLTAHPKESVFVAQTNGNYLALFSSMRPYRINKKKRYEGHKVEGFAVGCEFSPDGMLLATGSSEGKVFFYNYHTARIVRTLSAHSQACVSATFHPVLLSLLATCDWSGEIKIWQ